MANFRCERMFIMLNEPVPGLDHINAVDPVGFAYLDFDDDAEALDLTPFSYFATPPWEPPRWNFAYKGLETTQGLIELCEKWLKDDSNPYGYKAEVVEKNLKVLRQIEDVLEKADSYDRKFFIGVKDLG